MASTEKIIFDNGEMTPQQREARLAKEKNIAVEAGKNFEAQSTAEKTQVTDTEQIKQVAGNPSLQGKAIGQTLSGSEISEAPTQALRDNPNQLVKALTEGKFINNKGEQQTDLDQLMNTLLEANGGSKT